MTEIGRRAAILAGTGAFAISALIGIFTNGDLIMVSILGLVAGIIFGLGGLLVGNLIDSYIVQAAKREVARRVIERQLAAELHAQAETGKTGKHVAAAVKETGE